MLAWPWLRKRIEPIDCLNEELHRQSHAVQTFQDANAAIRKYSRMNGQSLDQLLPEPTLFDLYTPSDGQKNHEIAFIILGMAAARLVAYKFAK